MTHSDGKSRPCFQGGHLCDTMIKWFLNIVSAHRGDQNSSSSDSNTTTTNNNSNNNNHIFPNGTSPLFSFIWLTDWTHELLNGARAADHAISQMLKKMKVDGDLERGVLFFLSDHGFRKTQFSRTKIGQLENKLPFLFIAFPSWFQRRFPQLMKTVPLWSITAKNTD